MANYNFRKDLPIAKETEVEVSKVLEKLYNAEILDFEDTNKYDILTKIKDKEVTFEVKEDFMCWRTGNVAVEYECRGKPSGIETTESDFYIYKINYPENKVKYVMHKTDIIRDMIKKKNYFRIVNGGDKGSNSMNYLFKYDVFVKTGTILPLDKN